MNCDECIKECGGECCSNVIMEREIWERFKEKAVRLPYMVLNAPNRHGKDLVYVPTMTRFCPFLNARRQCVIYEDRPQICREFGCASHITNTCFHLRPDGTRRTKREGVRLRKKLEKFRKKNEERMKEFEKRLEVNYE